MANRYKIRTSREISDAALVVLGNTSNVNTGDQTSVSGNAGTATALQTARTIGTATGDVTSAGSSFDGSANNTNALTIANSAVTLAKMANLAQDQFIGRTTASTGVPETATITAAARTVLDDTTVGAMVDTLGGATSTGTGGIARATSPTFVTPALGTPSALVATNATGTATGLTSGITNALKSATTTVDVSAATAPTSGQVLTATSSTAATWQTPSGSGFTSRFQVQKSGDQSITGGAGDTKITFTSEIFDSSNEFASSSFTPGTTGYYLVRAIVSFQASSSSQHLLKIKAGGTEIQRVRIRPADTSTECSYEISGIFNLTASSAVDFYINAPGNCTISEFSGNFVTQCMGHRLS